MFVRANDYWPEQAPSPEHTDMALDAERSEQVAAWIVTLPTRERLHTIEFYEAWNGRRYRDLRDRVKRLWGEKRNAA